MDDDERQLLASTFDIDAKGYDDGRPDYPAEAWEIVLRHLGLADGATSLEIGPGTGQATARLLGTGAAVHAVEPGAELSAVLCDRFAALPFAVETCALEDADLVDESFDAAVAATAFHWVDPDIGVPILRRVLKPGAPLCLWWNVYRDPAATAVDEIDAVVRGSTELPNTRGLNGILDELELPRRLAEAGFVDIEQHTIRWTGVHNEAGLIALFRSFSDMRKRHHTGRDIVLARLRGLVRRNGGTVERPYTTPILLARAPG